jgi:hypothetical protein
MGMYLIEIVRDKKLKFYSEIRYTQNKDLPAVLIISNN